MRNLFKILLVLSIFFCFFNSVNAATITSTSTGGNWNEPSTWIGGVVPASDDSVVINGITTITGDTVLNGDVEITGSGVLRKDTNNGFYTLTINGDVENNGIIGGGNNVFSQRLFTYDGSKTPPFKEIGRPIIC